MAKELIETDKTIKTPETNRKLSAMVNKGMQTPNTTNSIHEIKVQNEYHGN